MPGKKRVKVGTIGSRFEADFLAESFRIIPDMRYMCTGSKKIGLTRLFICTPS